MMRRGYLYNLLLLAVILAYVYDVVQESVELNKLADTKRANLRQRKMVEERLLKAQQYTWTQCVAGHWTTDECKEFIDQYIYDNFEGKDRYTRTLIEGRRKETDELYNVVVIYMNDADMVTGRFGDGYVHYDFPWVGSGEAATPEQQSQIPPIEAMELDASLADIGLPEGSVEVISDQSVEGVVPAPLTLAPVTPTPAPVTSAPSPTPPVPAEPVVTTPAPTIGVLPTAPVSPPPPPDETTYTDETTTYVDAYPSDDAYSAYAYDDATVETTDLLQVFSEPVTDVPGSSVEEYIAQSSTQAITTQAPGAGAGGTTVAPGGTTADPGGGETTAETYPIIAGGVLTDHTEVNTEEGDQKVIAAVSAEVVIPEAGERIIDPIDCGGTTGQDCCLMIKLAVPDSDQNGKAIQCKITYDDYTDKKTYWKNLRGKKVHIKGNHNNYVMENPEMSGTWPKGKDGAEFEEWLSKAGALPLIMQGVE